MLLFVISIIANTNIIITNTNIIITKNRVIGFVLQGLLMLCVIDV